MSKGQEPVRLRTKADNSGKEEGMEVKTAVQEKVAWKALTLRIPAEVHRALKIKAAADRSNMGIIVEKLIREYLNRGPKP